MNSLITKARAPLYKAISMSMLRSMSSSIAMNRTFESSLYRTSQKSLSGKRFFSNYNMDEENPSSEEEYSDYSNSDDAEAVARVGSLAPTFSGQAVVNGKIKTIDFDEFRGKYVVLFFYPLNFTFVCPTEILKFNDMVKKFESLDCQIIGASMDSEFSHLAWTKAPKKNNGLETEIQFPLLADHKGHIANAYGAMNLNDTFPLRATYIIDKSGEIRHISLNDAKIGRSVDEIYRLVEAIKHSDDNGEMCPVNWKKGEKGIKE